ncbi:MAG TPA: response regulator [Opitutaceae bacterium]|jgi:CheY-like chemotaxis protein|nr:response regulator [Opitutaceae bacterium]
MTPPPSNLRPILLAEDNPNDVELTLSALHSLNLANEIVVTKDGRDALDWLHSQGDYAGRPRPHPAVLLIDLKMPRIDGLEVLRQVRADPSTRTMAVVLLTSSREESDLVKGYALGANAYVVKPVAFEQFIAAVNQLGVFWALLNEPPPSQPLPPAAP